MGSYTFTWEHPAEEVYVTGQFDSWKKSVRLDKEDGIFKKTVELPKEKTLYKFVVNGEWVVNDTAPKENDDSGIVNNVLSPDQIQDTVSTLSSAAPTSTTAALAGNVPKESDKSAPVGDKPTPSAEFLPGAFPLTPPAATPGSEPQAFSVNPIPATEGPGNPVTLAPGEKVPDSSTLTTNTIDSTVKHEPEPEEEKVSVAPIPATAGLGNPIQLAPGEKVPDPSTLTSNTIASTATTDATSYEKSDALPPKVDVVLTPEDERKANGGMFHLPPSVAGIIPESSLAKDAPVASEQDPGVTIQSAAPASTTAALAGAVPKEPRAVEEPSVPETVVDSQKEAGIAPEASANPEAVAEKSQVEQELKKLVPEEPPAAEASLLDRATAATAPAVSQASEVAQQASTAAAAAITAAAGAFAGATYAAKDKAAETTGLTEPATASQAVPEVVAESQKEAHVSPEAAANTEAVVEKKAVESELLKEVPEAKPAAESAVEPETAVKEVPAVVAESQKEAHASPEAAANPEAVVEKKAVESELLQEVTKTDEAGPPAPTVTAATSATAPGLSENALSDSKPLKSSSEPDALNAPAAKPAVPETSKPIIDSRDVSPMSKPVTNAEQPTVTTGTETTTTDTKSTPKKDEPAAAESSSTPESAVTDKKKKRRSFFGKLKDKFSSKS